MLELSEANKITNLKLVGGGKQFSSSIKIKTEMLLVKKKKTDYNSHEIVPCLHLCQFLSHMIFWDSFEIFLLLFCSIAVHPYRKRKIKTLFANYSSQCMTFFVLILNLANTPYNAFKKLKLILKLMINKTKLKPNISQINIDLFRVFNAHGEHVFSKIKRQF